MRNEDIFTEATRRVRAKKGFFYHLIAYIGVIGMLYALMNFENGGQLLPVIIVGLSWGIGLCTHYFTAFGTEHLEFLGFNSNWEEDELEKEIDRLRRLRELKEQILEERNLLDDLDRLELLEIEKREIDREFE